MSNTSLIVFKNRTNIVIVSLGYDISQDTFVSEIREDKDSASTLIATWETEFLTDGVDGDLKITLDDSAVDAITQTFGFMDMKRISGGEPLPVFGAPLKVRFKDSVTA